ncbi:hypothetical protein EDD11_005646 [Mortierella claussenii]|nr:hypothetical protein EDD11_005646 [Mortierella claussenii]
MLELNIKTSQKDALKATGKRIKDELFKAKFTKDAEDVLFAPELSTPQLRKEVSLRKKRYAEVTNELAKIGTGDLRVHNATME